MRLGEDVSIGRDTVVMFGTLRAARPTGGDQVQPSAHPDPVPDPDRAGQAGGRGTALYRAMGNPAVSREALDVPARPTSQTSAIHHMALAGDGAGIIRGQEQPNGHLVGKNMPLEALPGQNLGFEFRNALGTLLPFRYDGARRRECN